jgi:hypothetical protein
MLAHEGSKAYGEAFELIHRREADRPNRDMASGPHASRYHAGARGNQTS